MARVPKRYRPLESEIMHGVSLAALYARCAGEDQKRRLNSGLEAMSTRNPVAYDRLMGAPASDLLVLADVCVRSRAIAPIHRCIGRVHAVKYVEGFNQSASDPEVLDMAIERGYDLLITNDAADQHPDDMCVNANWVYQINGSQKNPRNLTSVVVIPQGKEEEVLRKNRDRIVEYALSVPAQTLDLRGM